VLLLGRGCALGSCELRDEHLSAGACGLAEWRAMGPKARGPRR
jgi:hypothetical protein